MPDEWQRHLRSRLKYALVNSWNNTQYILFIPHYFTESYVNVTDLLNLINKIITRQEAYNTKKKYQLIRDIYKRKLFEHRMWWTANI